MNIIDDFRKPEYNFLMNSYNCPVNLDGIMYPSVEHAYQAAKTVDTMARERIRFALSARAAKKVGRTLKLRYNWDNMRLDVMRKLLIEKFANSECKSKLLATRNSELISGGDSYWGEVAGYGENNLGKLLMELRANIIKLTQTDFVKAKRSYLVSSGWERNADEDEAFGECWCPPWSEDCCFDLDSAVLHQSKLSSEMVDDEDDDNVLDDLFVNVGLFIDDDDDDDDTGVPVEYYT